MHEALRDRPPESDPRWSITPPDPISAAAFPFFHEKPDQINYSGASRSQMLMSGTYMGQELKVPVVDRRDGITNEKAYVEAAFDLSYDIAKWLECAAHFFQIRCSCYRLDAVVVVFMMLLLLLSLLLLLMLLLFLLLL